MSLSARTAYTSAENQSAVWPSIWTANLTVFVASCCTLIIEILAGRILAPYLGVSLYTWTSIIGVVLAGISLGNYLGGRLADRRASPTTLGLVFLAASLTTIGVLVTTGLILGRGLPWAIPLVGRIVLLNVIIFFLPSLVLGMVTPVVIKLTLVDLSQTGSTVGTIYAFSTAGSILGTFATGFFLIEAFGTRAIVVGVAVVLFLMAILTGQFWRQAGRLAVVIALGMVVAGGLFYFKNTFLNSPCLKETGYYCIQVQGYDFGGDPTVSLVLDHLTHTKVSLGDPKHLGFSYIRTYADVTAIKALDKPDFKALFIGGGGYGFPRYVEAVYPDSEIHVIEIDPWVTEISYRELGLSRDTRIRSYNQDARMFLMQWQDPPKFDIIYGDAFNDLAMPYHLTTVEFDRMIYGLLTDDGIYLANVIDDYREGEMLRAFINTVAEVFPYVYVMRWGRLDPGMIETLVVAGAKQPLDVSLLDDVARSQRLFGRVLGSTVIAPDELARYRQAGRRIILTDDYAPVDQLAARLFVIRGY